MVEVACLLTIVVCHKAQKRDCSVKREVRVISEVVAVYIMSVFEL